MKSTLSFYGGAETVTGANFLLDTGDVRLLVDCGLIQGERQCEAQNRDPFPYDPASVNILFVTHAHMDHIGRIPKLVRDGFSGVIYSTRPTKELAVVLFEDALGILDHEARREGLLPLYEKDDVAKTLALWKTVEYDTPFELGSGLSVTASDAGHILGSAMYRFSRAGKLLLFTGDLGNSPAPLLRDTAEVSGANYIVMESVYGDRNHEPHDERSRKFEAIVEDTIANRRTLVIPAFSVDRTQILLFELNQLVERKGLGPVRVFLDSPLGIAATGIYRAHADLFNADVQRLLESDKDVLDFPRLELSQTVEDSKEIARWPNPKIIIAGSGMSGGGRILYHERHFLPDPKTTFLLVGYQAVGTLGRKIQDGAKRVRIMREDVPVHARIETIQGYSSHKDSAGLVDFVSKSSRTLASVFVVMGEPKASLFLVQRLRDYLNVHAVTPRYKESVELEF
jgi:metallo-beta-lactamase family protein